MMKKPCNMDRNVADLLVSTQFLKPADLDRALAECRDKGVPLSNILLNNQLIAPNLLVAAMQVSVEVKENRLSSAGARDVLHLMGHYELPLAEAMEKLGVTPVRNPWMSSLDRIWWFDGCPENKRDS